MPALHRPKAGVTAPTLAQRLCLVQGYVAKVVQLYLAGVMHRDIKPDNLMVDIGRDRAIKDLHWTSARLVDFGMAQSPGVPIELEYRETGTALPNGNNHAAVPEMYPGPGSEPQVAACSDLVGLAKVMADIFLFNGRIPCREFLSLPPVPQPAHFSLHLGASPPAALLLMCRVLPPAGAAGPAVRRPC